LKLLLTGADPTNDAETGGSPVLAYSVEIDDGNGGDFVSLSDASMSLQYSFRFVEMAGKVFRSRYRIRNGVGFSDYSPIAYTRAAQVPAAPAYPPSLVTSSGIQMSITLTRSAENGGSVVVRHELWIDDGALGTFS
jgi:hypothetical protein